MEKRLETSPPATAADQAKLRNASSKDLAAELARKATELARKEVALAKSEVKEDIRAGIKMASGLGVAGVCALITLQMLLVALVLGLAEADVMRGWLASLLVAFVVLAIGTVAGIFGWKKRVTQPLDSTRRSLEENVKWVKDRTA